jgi:hypothetical protein
MAFLVLLSRSSNTCSLQILDEGAMVPKETITWYIERPEHLTKVNHAIKKYWVGGSIYAGGGIIAIGQDELTGIISSMLGPSNEEIKAKPKTSQPVWMLILIGLTSFTLTMFWLGLQTIMLIALVPVLIFFFGRRMR